MCQIIDEVISRNEPSQVKQLQALRSIIHETASSIPQIEKVQECLKWGQPSFITEPVKIGSTIRIDAKAEGVSIYFICSTNLIEQFREFYPDHFDYVGNREIHFSPDADLTGAELKHCIAMALTYHLNKKN